MKPNMFEMSRTFSRYLEKKFEIFRKKLGISGNIFRWFFVIFLSRPKRGYIWSPPPILCGKLNFQNAISCEWMVKFRFFFFNFDILMVISFRNHHQISYNTKNKIWRELCEILFLPKIPKSEKQKTYNFRE